MTRFVGVPRSRKDCPASRTNDQARKPAEQRRPTFTDLGAGRRKPLDVPEPLGRGRINGRGPCRRTPSGRHSPCAWCFHWTDRPAVLQAVRARPCGTAGPATRACLPAGPTGGSGTSSSMERRSPAVRRSTPPRPQAEFEGTEPFCRGMRHKSRIHLNEKIP